MRLLRTITLTLSTAVLLALVTLMYATPARAWGLCHDYCSVNHCLTGCVSLDGVHYFMNDPNLSTCGPIPGGEGCQYTCSYTIPC